MCVNACVYVCVWGEEVFVCVRVRMAVYDRVSVFLCVRVCLAVYERVSVFVELRNIEG